MSVEKGTGPAQPPGSGRRESVRSGWPDCGGGPPTGQGAAAGTKGPAHRFPWGGPAADGVRSRPPTALAPSGLPVETRGLVPEADYADCPRLSQRTIAIRAIVLPILGQRGNTPRSSGRCHLNTSGRGVSRGEVDRRVAPASAQSSVAHPRHFAVFKVDVGIVVRLSRHRVAGPLVVPPHLGVVIVRRSVWLPHGRDHLVRGLAHYQLAELLPGVDPLRLALGRVRPGLGLGLHRLVGNLHRPREREAEHRAPGHDHEQHTAQDQRDDEYRTGTRPRRRTPVPEVVFVLVVRSAVGGHWRLPVWLLW